jgi:glutamyl-tRNA reductase
LDFLVVGLNHRTAPLDIREKLAVTKEQLPDTLHALGNAVGHGVVLCTCNRSEIYAMGEEPDLDEGVEAFLNDHFGVSLPDIRHYLYSYRDMDCVHHLFRVASSLDSMILGEGEILGQVRDAFGAAVQADTVEGPLSRLFHQSLRVGKKVRRETAIGKNALSVSRVCVQLARNLRSDISQLKVLVIGVGEAGELAARSLKDSGVEDVIVTNRTYGRAEELAGKLMGEAVPFGAIPEVLKGVDIVIASTDAPAYVLEPDAVWDAMAARPDRPLFLIDIAVPRDIHPDSGLVNNVLLYDVDDLRTLSDSNRAEREREAQLAEDIVAKEVKQFAKSYRALEVVPTISALRNKADEIRNKELDRLVKRMGATLGLEDARHLDAMTRALVNKLLHSPTTFLKKSGTPDHVRMARELFGLEDQDMANGDHSGERD